MGKKQPYGTFRAARIVVATKKNKKKIEDAESEALFLSSR
jgi:hypothetical protein